MRYHVPILPPCNKINIVDIRIKKHYNNFINFVKHSFWYTIGILTFYTCCYTYYIKINKAKDLLLSGECNVSEAAFSVGFENVHYFSRTFKKITGVNPSKYLKSS
ncbi:MAG TPA: helix-turn-helix transcriptional regulator [Clostridiaceae bacterium]|nr:helix-turn-helix transcriptional regulator [Clostridiaceae bacterium]